jgi:hypothetical protein
MKLRRTDETKIERMIPSNAADYLEPRPNEPRYAKPFVLDGKEYDLNAPGPLADSGGRTQRPPPSARG